MTPELSLLRFLLKHPSHVVEGLQVDPKPGRVFHISPDPKIKEFVPREIQRTMKGEDELVERVCTAQTLLDCFRGYGVALNDFVAEKAHCAGNNGWLGGYVIYGIDHQGCLIPSAKLCPISEWCDERWLVSHQCEKQAYPTEIVGKAFINRLSVKRDAEEKIIETELLLEILKGDLHFTPEIVLEKGFHCIRVGSLEKYVSGKDSTETFQHARLSQSDYLRQKDQHAELLSYESAHSTITHW